MADNYLEKKMDDYARGKLAASTRRTSGLKCIKIPPKRVLVINADGKELLLKALVELGYKVAFTLADATGGNTMAQATGARFYPFEAGRALEQLASAGDPAAGIVAPRRADVPPEAEVAVCVLTEEAGGGGYESVAGRSDAAAALLVAGYLYGSHT